jgi:hypothetical protein
VDLGVKKKKYRFPSQKKRLNKYGYNKIIEKFYYERIYETLKEE